MNKIFLLLLVCGMAASCKSVSNDKGYKNSIVEAKEKKTVRYGMVTGVKPEKLDYYKQLHGHPWPAVLAKIKECHIEDYSIFLQKTQDKYYLFSYFEYSGNDFDSDMKKMAADTITQRWWRETDPCQLPLPEAAAKKQIWTRMDEVFHNE
jgi:L-rhamnose mutarotase